MFTSVDASNVCFPNVCSAISGIKNSAHRLLVTTFQRRAAVVIYKLYVLVYWISVVENYYGDRVCDGFSIQCILYGIPTITAEGYIVNV